MMVYVVESPYRSVCFGPIGDSASNFGKLESRLLLWQYEFRGELEGFARKLSGRIEMQRWCDFEGSGVITNSLASITFWATTVLVL